MLETRNARGSFVRTGLEKQSGDGGEEGNEWAKVEFCNQVKFQASSCTASTHPPQRERKS